MCDKIHIQQQSVQWKLVFCGHSYTYIHMLYTPWQQSIQYIALCYKPCSNMYIHIHDVYTCSPKNNVQIKIYF